MHEALVVADDLTGAADAGSRFAARGFATSVRTHTAGDAPGDPDGDVPGGPDGDVPVLVVDTDSRYAPPDEAADRVAAAVEAHPAGAVYKKVDSTLRGNLVAEVDAALAAAGADLAVVAPAFPANGRTTAGGFHLVGGTPVADAVDDPDRPVETSRLPARLAGSAYPVEHLPLDVAGEGAGAVREALAAVHDEHGTLLVACDATRPEHLSAIADGAAALDADPLYVGSAGLAGHVRPGGGEGAVPGSGSVGGGVLGIVGSVTGTAFAQLQAVEDAPGTAVVTLDGPAAVSDPDRVAGETVPATREAAAAAADALAAGDRVVVTAATGPDDVEATLAAAREAGIGEADARGRVAAALGAVAARVRERTAVGGLVLTGGAVAGRTLAALDAHGLRPTGRSVAAGVPLGRVAGGPADGTPVVTKAGAFGGDETIVNCLDFLARHDD